MVKDTFDDARENYKGAQFNQRIGFGKRPALVVVDMVAGYTDPQSPLYAQGAVGALASALRVIEASREAEIPVIFTDVSLKPADEAGSVWSRKTPLIDYFYEGSPLGQFAEGIEPQENEQVVTKQYASCFFGTTFAASLVSRGIDTLIVTGVSTSGCVRATVVDAVSHGFIPIVVREAVGDRHPAPHEANLFDIDAKYGDVVSEGEVLEFLKNCGPQGTVD